MTIFIEALLGSSKAVDCSALQQAIVDRFGLGAHVELGGETPLTRYLGLSPSETPLIVSLYDAPQTNVAMILGCELDWSPESGIHLPLKFIDRLSLLVRVLEFVRKDQSTFLEALGISDGDYFYETQKIDFEKLEDAMLADSERDCFLGKVYTFVEASYAGQTSRAP